MQRSIEVVRDAVRTDRVSYGITTGFGAFANKRISADQVRQLQLNLVRSHACGIGEPLAAPLVRRMLLLKANSLAAGISGVRTELRRRAARAAQQRRAPDHSRAAARSAHREISRRSRTCRCA